MAVPKPHVQVVRDWLAANTFDATHALAFAVLDLTIEWERFPQSLRGTFDLEIDGVRYPSPFLFGFGCTPEVQIQPPMFWSPLGAPASVTSIDLTEDAWTRLSRAIQRILPPVRGVLWEDSLSAPITIRMPANFDTASWQQTFKPPARIEL